MIKTAIIAAALSISALTACSKAKRTTAVVVTDCSGVYLRIDGTDYQVCNEARLSRFKEGDRLNVRYKRTKQCLAQGNTIRCKLYHQNAGWIEVTSVKK